MPKDLVQPHHLEQLEVPCLAQGHSDMWTGRVQDWTANPVISGRPALSPEPEPPQICKQFRQQISKSMFDFRYIHTKA